MRTIAICGLAVAISFVAREARADRGRPAHPVRLTERACLAALYPGSSWPRRVTGAADGARPVRAVAILDLGASAICQVDVQGDGKVEVKVAAFAFATRWTASAPLALEYPIASADPDDPGGHEQTGTIAVAPIALAVGAAAIDVAITTDESGTMMSAHREAHTIYQVTPAGLVEIFAYESTSGGGESSTSDACTLAIEPTVRRGWRDLTVTCVHQHERYPGDPDDHDSESTTTQRVCWTGHAYAAP